MFDRSDARLRRKPILSNPLVTFRCVSEVTGAESANPPPPLHVVGEEKHAKKGHLCLNLEVAISRDL